MITVITPTADRPAAWPLAERWMRAQTRQPDQWIVVDDGIEAAPLTMGQTHIRRERKETGGASLARNILAAIPEVKGQFVVIWEDDDALRPNHIEVCVERLRKYSAVGCTWLDYYNLEHSCWRTMRNKCAALCNTAMRRDQLPLLKQAAKRALRRDMYHVDRFFWQLANRAGLHEQRTVVGIKGLPGMPGIGIGHRPTANWHPDPTGAKLREWLGEDAAAYGR